MSNQVNNSKDRFSSDMAHLILTIIGNRAINVTTFDKSCLTPYWNVIQFSSHRHITYTDGQKKQSK